MESQGYTVEHNILYQDNKSTILLATNGRSSSSKRTKHINHRYYLIKDLVDRGDIEIMHAPTEEMWSDVLTKPQQGMLFKKMRAVLMNVDVNYDDDLERRNTHPMLLPEMVETLPDETIKILANSGVTGVSRKKRTAITAKVSANKRVTWKVPLTSRRSVLSDSDIAEKSIAQIKKNRVVRTLKSRRGNVGGGITRGLRKHSRTSDTFLRQ